MTRRSWAAIVLVLILALAAIWLLRRPGGTLADGSGTVPRVVAAGTRIRVEVLNATDSRGLARQAMFVLRDAGFDVVSFGNSAERSDLTVVRDRSAHAGWAQLAAKVMAPARVEQKPDSSHFLDLTVLVGSRWVPPRRSLYP